MEIHRAAYRWTSDELVTAMRRHLESQLRASVAWCVAVALLLGATISISLIVSRIRYVPGHVIYLVPEQPVLYLIMPILAVFWCVHLADKALDLHKARRQFSRDPGADQMIEWEVSAKEVKYYQRGLFYTAAAWKNFIKVSEVRDGFLLYTHGQAFVWLPFRAFDDPEAPERVRELMRASGVPYRKISS